MTMEHSSPQETRRRAEKLRQHYLSYVLSILLTILAFAITIFGGFGGTSKYFLYSFLLLLAIVQVIFQLAYWMHMKERGNLYPIIGLAFGLFVALGGVLSAIFWTWWVR